MYVDTRLHHMLDLRLNVPFFERGDFPAVVQNGSQSIVLKNPWANGTKAAPFDQCKSCVHVCSAFSCPQLRPPAFYLILDVGIGKFSFY